MILDKQLVFGEDLAIFGGDGTVNVGDTVDTGTDGHFATNENGKLYLAIDAPVVGGTSIQFQLVSDATSTPATDGSQTIHFRSDAYPVAELVAGKKIILVFPQGDTYERYLGVQVIRVGTSTQGTINAAVVRDAQNWRTYPEGNN